MNSTETRRRANDNPPVCFGLPLEALPKIVPPAGSPCPGEEVLTHYASSPRHHPDRRRIAAHVRHCTDCALIAGGVAKLRQEAREEIGRAGALKYLRGEHPNSRRFEVHSERCGACRLWLIAFRPFFLPLVRSPIPAWATSAVLCAALVVSVATRPRLHDIQPKDATVPVGASTDSRAVADYLQQFSRPSLTRSETEELRKLTNLLESRLYSDPALEQDASFLLLVGALFQRRHELTGEARALAKANELLASAQQLLRAKSGLSPAPTGGNGSGQPH